MNFRAFNRFNAAACCIAGLLLLADNDTASAQKPAFTEKQVAFLEYPDFPEAHSTWGSIGYNAASNTVHIGVTNHRNKIGLYAFDPLQNKMKLNVFIGDMANLRSFQWQGIIHS